MATIVIDPGHGGASNLLGSSATGAVGPSGTLEKTLTLDVALRVAASLTAAEHSVLLTRQNDVNVGLADRARVAQSAQAEVFLSIHFNAVTDPTVQGTETFVRPAGSGASAAVNPESARLADSVQTKLVEALGLQNRGVRRARFGVLSDSIHLPATARCLAECSFLSDPAEEARLADSSYRDRIAGALVHAVTWYTDLLAGTAAQAYADYGRVASGGNGSNGARMVGGRVAATSARATFGGPVHRGSARARRDPDAYGDARDAGEGFERDAGRSCAALQSTGEHTDAHCPESSAASAGTTNFSLSEFRCADGTDCPERFRGHLQVLMNNLEVLRAELGNARIRINSGYRTPSYNQTLEGAAATSQHMCGRAADITVEGWTPRDVGDTIESLISAGRMREGGLGRYESFIHYDVRDGRSRWTG